MIRTRGIIDRISIAVFSNMLSFVVSTLMVLIIPKYLSVDQNGYYHIYLFYVGYIGFVNMGWPEGILLKYGGKDYDELNKNGLKRQFIIFMQMVLFLSIIIISVALYCSNSSKTYVWVGLGVTVFVTASSHFLQVLLHMTNRTKEYAKSIILDRIFYFVLVVLFVFWGLREYHWLIIADICGRALSLVYVIKANWSIFDAKATKASEELTEIQDNICVGIKLLLSNLVSILLIGIIRQSIELKWGVETFAKVSLTLSISNMLMIFIRAVAVVLFPMLKRIAIDVLHHIYGCIRTGLMVIMLGILVIYYPIKIFLIQWLPNYIESINYVALLFPICIFECRFSLLVETYMKTLRLEKKLLYINVLSVMLSIILSIISVFVLENIIIALASIVVVVGFRSVIAELELCKYMDNNYSKTILVEIIYLILFIVFNWTIGGIHGCVLYLVLYLIYIIAKWKDLKIMVIDIKQVLIKERS